MFLTRDEIVKLTGRTKYSCQLVVLRQRGIPHDEDGDGRPVILHSALHEHMMGRKAKSTGPDWSHVA